MSDNEVVFIGRDVFPLEWSERRDSGGMFEDTVGVYKDGDKYYAFVKWWGGGRAGPSFSTPQDAKVDVERLWQKTYGYGA